MESNSGPEDILTLSAFDFSVHNPLRSLCLVSSGIGRLCSKKSTLSFATPAISASSCCVNCKEMRKLAALKPIDDPRTKLRTVVIVFPLLDKDTSSKLNEQAYAYPLQMGTLTQKTVERSCGRAEMDNDETRMNHLFTRISIYIHFDNLFLFRPELVDGYFRI